jgi:hypothetical protein
MRRFLIPFLVFAVILIHGSLVGLTDDEAYYWVLAQKPALGYAFHPPAIGLVVALSQAMFGWLFGHHSAMLVRLPAAVCSAGMVALGIRWMESAGAGEAASRRGALALVSFAGIFALSWMIVPDLPLFLGWTIAYFATWLICFSETAGFLEFGMLAVGLTLAILSKYSGVLAGASAAGGILLWAPRERRIKGLAAVVMGGLMAAVPILAWNATHQWASILYQVRERHGDAHLSLVRYLRFWAIELVLAGPALVIFSVSLMRRWLRRMATRAESYAMIWVIPGAAVFFLQPLWSEFKPHWALIVWWPLALAFACSWAQPGGERLRGLIRLHISYGLTLIALVLFCCYVPVGNLMMARYGHLDPKLDVTNDLYGWPELRQFVLAQGGEEALHMPMVGSRYQTASQAAFAMGEGTRVTMLPRDQKAMDEWPDLGVSENQGPVWPRLTAPILFVADNRYDSGPDFPGAHCEKKWTLERQRAGLAAKTIFIWKCAPASLPASARP